MRSRNLFLVLCGPWRASPPQWPAKAAHKPKTHSKISPPLNFPYISSKCPQASKLSYWRIQRQAQASSSVDSQTRICNRSEIRCIRERRRHFICRVSFKRANPVNSMPIKFLWSWVNSMRTFMCLLFHEMSHSAPSKPRSKVRSSVHASRASSAYEVYLLLSK